MRLGHMAPGCPSQRKRERGRAKRLGGAELLPQAAVSLIRVSACASATASSVQWCTECEQFAMAQFLSAAAASDHTRLESPV